MKRVREQIDLLSAPYKKSGVTYKRGELEKQEPELKAKLAPLQKEQDELRGKLKQKPHTRVLTDNDQPSQNYLLRRGDPASFGEPVDPNVPQVLRNASLNLTNRFHHFLARADAASHSPSGSLNLHTL